MQHYLRIWCVRKFHEPFAQLTFKFMTISRSREVEVCDIMCRINWIRTIVFENNGLLCFFVFITGMQSYIVQLDFSAAFVRVSYSGIWFKLKSIGVGCSLLFVCREFLSNRRQRGVVDGATGEWVPIVSGVPQGSVLGSLLFILFYQRNVWGGREQPICLYWWLHITGSCLQPADRPAVAASLNRELSKIQQWCNRNLSSAIQHDAES